MTPVEIVGNVVVLGQVTFDFLQWSTLAKPAVTIMVALDGGVLLCPACNVFRADIKAALGFRRDRRHCHGLLNMVLHRQP